jgi:hypothetical protein
MTTVQVSDMIVKHIIIVLIFNDDDAVGAAPILAVPVLCPMIVP